MSTVSPVRTGHILEPHEVRAHVDFPTVAGFVSTHLNNYAALAKDLQSCITALKANPKDFQGWGAACQDAINQAVTLLQDWTALNLTPSPAHIQLQMHALETAAAGNPSVWGDGTLLKAIFAAGQQFLNSPLGQTLEQALLNALLGGLLKPPAPVAAS